MNTKMDKKSTDYRNIKAANQCFLFCILFEVAGIMTILFFGTLGAEMAIYFMTFLFALFLARKHREDIEIPFAKPKPGKVLHCIGITICGIPIAMLLNALTGLLTTAGADTTDDVTVYPIWLSLIVFAIVPAIVEEYVFRGVVLGAYQRIGIKAAIFISSMFFALLHFSLGSVLYGFFFGCVFALVRTVTGNMIYSMIMHCTFNALNVVLSYVNLANIPDWSVIAYMVVGVVGFVVLMVMLVKDKESKLELEKESENDGGKVKYRKWQLMTKEGYVSVVVCLVVMGMLLSM
jgi:membrane protease YdiL (CAAX protease family)